MAQADDPAALGAVGINASEHGIAGAAQGADARLAIVLPAIDGFQGRAIEQQGRQFERQAARLGIDGAFGRIPFEQHRQYMRL